MQRENFREPFLPERYLPSQAYAVEYFSRGGAEAQRNLFMKMVYAARDSVPEDSFPEVQKIAELDASEPEIGLNLFLWEGMTRSTDLISRRPGPSSR